MKRNRKYVVIVTNGYYIGRNKKDALAFQQETNNALHVIETRAEVGNYYHNRIKVISA